MRIMYVHCFDMRKSNLGDDVYLHGTQSLLTSAFGEHTMVRGNTIDWLFHGKMQDYANLDLDLIVTTGAPWVDNAWHNYPTCTMLRDFIKLYPKVPKIAFGLGGCSGLEAPYFASMDALDAAKEVFGKFDLVLTRDPLTGQFLSLSGVPNHTILDSAMFFPIDNYVRDLNLTPKMGPKPVFIYYDFRIGISKHSWKGGLGDKMEDMYKYIVQKYDPKIICVFEPELQRAHELGFTDIELVNEFEDIIPILSEASFVVGGRVHQSVLAALLGKRTYVIPFDIRYLSCAPLADPLFLQAAPELQSTPYTFKDALLSRAREIIVKLVQGVMYDKVTSQSKKP